MSNHTYEIEIKSLLGHQDKAEALKMAMRELDPGFIEHGAHKQLNHYFIGGNLLQLAEKLETLLPEDKKALLADIAEKAKDFSVRTRWADGKVLIVVKASVDDTTSSNGTARLEWESEVSITIEELDQLVLTSGFQYQAKWSREREDFSYKGANVSIDKNAGYGYLAEFEMIADNVDAANITKQKLREMMKELGVEELPQDRLGRMFDFYNSHWQEYYGTENIFTIE
jgi:predicted adenylyl cyclase CyaB